MDKNFVRIGKWFVRPYEKDEKPVNKRWVILTLLFFDFFYLTMTIFGEEVGGRSSLFIYFLIMLLNTVLLNFCGILKIALERWLSITHV